MKRLASIVLLISIVTASFISAQDANTGPARSEFEKTFTDWKTNLKTLRDLVERFRVAENSELPDIREKFKSTFEATDNMVPDLRSKALAAFEESPNTDRALTRMLISMGRHAIQNDRYSEARKITDVLIANKCDEKILYDIAGTAFYATDDFETAAEYLSEAQSLDVLDLGKDYAANVQQMLSDWEKEKEIRAAEAEADDLPRVRLTTTKGDIVLELYENEAPDTVGNFISLVSKGYYDGLIFHRVLPGFMAQGGDPKGDGTGGPGYNIYCECYQDNYRRHFSGTLSMAKSPARDTGGSQFFLTFLPTPHLNGKHTAFGRIIEGMEVLEQIQRVDPDSPESASVAPDKIETAEVLRKREHEYVPNKVR